MRQFVPNTRKALRTGIVVCMGGEFGFALLTLLLKGRVVDPGIVQALLTTVALSMLLGPLLVRYNGASPTSCCAGARSTPPRWRSRRPRPANSRGAST